MFTPMAFPWDSPKVLMLNDLPNMFPAMLQLGLQFIEFKSYFSQITPESRIRFGDYLVIGDFQWSRANGKRRHGHGHAMVVVGMDQGRFSRSEEHTSELQSLMRISYAVFCLKKKKKK